MRDPAEEVRNDSMRALWAIAEFARRTPALKIRVPSQPFIALLDSPVWSDRNKASLALMAISEGRDPTLLAGLRDKALGSLIQMARWKSDGYALAPFMLLGRASGLSDDAIHTAWTRGDRQAVIDTALRRRKLN